MNYLLVFIEVYTAISAGLYLASNVLSGKPQQLSSYYARSLATCGAGVVCAIYGVFSSAILRVIGKSGLSQWTVARSFKYSLWWVAGVWFDIIEGKEYLDIRPAVFVGNHQTCVLPRAGIRHMTMLRVG